MKDPNCAYCMEGALVEKFGIKICEMEHALVYLFKEQSHRGRCIVATKSHAFDITKLSEGERDGYFADMSKVAEAIQKAFGPDKINIGAYGDTAGHTHFHLVPKYKDEFEWGQVFAMNPEKVYLSDEEYGKVIGKITDNL